jgi:hypothetical protein
MNETKKIISYLVQIELRYNDVPTPSLSENRSKVVTIGIYDSLEESIENGNEAIKCLSSFFEVHRDDQFTLKNRLGYPKLLVSNCWYPTKNIVYYARIIPLQFSELKEAIYEVFQAYERYMLYLENECKYDTDS